MRCGALTGPLPKAAITARNQCVRNTVWGACGNGLGWRESDRIAVIRNTTYSR
jgi:hypothetical protein